MGAKKITGKPDKGVKSLSVVRQDGTHNMVATWKVPNDLVKDSNAKRATGLDINWTFEITNQKDPHKLVETTNEKKTSSSVNLNNLKIKNGNSTTTYTRDSFYPVTDKHLKSVSVKVTPTNKKGNGSKPQTASRSFDVPPSPTIDSIEFNVNADGRVSTTIRRVDGGLYQEQKDVYYKRTVYTSSTGETSTSDGNTFTGESHSVSYDVSGYQSLSTGSYVKVTWTAYSRGYAGKCKDDATRSFYVSYPAQATISTAAVSSKDSTGQVTVKLDTNKTDQHPVDITTLEYLADVTYSKASDIPSGASWTDGGAQDNGNCTALTIPVTGLVPTAGKHTWVRVKTARTNASSLVRYSEPVELTQLYTPAPTAADDEIKILSAASGDDGKSIVVVMGWNADGQDDSTGTELSWSTDEHAWRSTEEPETFTFTWSDGAKTHGGVTYHDSATVHIKGLEEATSYNIRARRYLESEEYGLSYSPYSNAAASIPHKVPTSVFPMCDSYVASGSPLTVRWTLSGATLQTAWRIRTATRVIAEGSNSLGSTQISAKRLKEVAANNAVTFYVEASTGSKYVASESRTVNIVDKPNISISVPQTMTAQSTFSFTVTSNRLADLIVIVTSQGASSNMPTGLVRQTSGDTIYSDVLRPVWTLSSNTYTATITLPRPLDFWDLGHYNVSVTAVDRETDLVSDTRVASFKVAWANQAVSPVKLTYTATTDTKVDLTKAYYAYDSSQGTYNYVDPVGNENPHTQGWYLQTETNYVFIKPIDQIVDGVHRQAAQITLTPPTGAPSGSLYDIYRMDVDHPTLIGENLPLSYTITDEYAPFGDDMDLFYRVALRTVDGDVEFADIGYRAQNKAIRFDWADGTLELPYGLSIGDSYTKDFEIRHHMDGSTDGYWNPNIDRKSSLSSSVIKIVQPDDVKKARQLARYAGAVFVRLPDGSAYEANVQVTDLSRKNQMVTQIAIDAEEIGATEEFMLPTHTTLGT